MRELDTAGAVGWPDVLRWDPAVDLAARLVAVPTDGRGFDVTELLASRATLNLARPQISTRARRLCAHLPPTHTRRPLQQTKPGRLTS